MQIIKHRITIGILCMLLASVSTGCTAQSVQDAQNIDISRADIVQSGDNDKGESPSVVEQQHKDTVWVSGRSTNIIEVEQGQTVSGGGFEITVLESWMTDDTLTILDDITGNDTFRKNIIKSSDEYDSDGKFTGRAKLNHIIIRLRLKCEYIGEGIYDNSTVYFSPIIFVKSSENSYTRMTSEGVAFDKSKNSGTKDGLKYTFTLGEELETLVVVCCSQTYSSDDDIYMFPGFLNMAAFGDGVNDIVDGTYMFKLDME